MSQKVNFIEKPYWVVFKNKSKVDTIAASEMEGMIAKVIGTYYVSTLHQQMFLVEYQEPHGRFERKIAGVLSPGSHYEFLGKGKKTDNYLEGA